MSAKKKPQACASCGMAFADLELTKARLAVAESAKQLVDIFTSRSDAIGVSHEESHAFGRLLARVHELRQVEQR